MHATKFVFEFPLTAGSFAERSKVISIHQFLTLDLLPSILNHRSQPLTLMPQITDYVDSRLAQNGARI